VIPLLVFIAGPIQGVEDKQEYRKVLKKLLEAHGYRVVDPWEREKVLYKAEEPGWWKEVPPRDFIKRDLEDIDRSDILLAYLPLLSAGTCMELFYAKMKGKRTIVICELKNPSPWILVHADELYGSIEEFKRALSGKPRSLRPTICGEANL